MKKSRKCAICRKLFNKPGNCSSREWEERRKTCSKECGYIYRTKKYTIWNKGLTKETNKSVAKQAKQMIGREPWCKGIRGKSHWMYGKKHTKETRLKMSKAHMGKNHWNWQGGITNAVHRLRQQMKSKEWRKKVLDKYNHTCQKCGSRERLQCHHIKSFRESENLRYEVSNGIVFCIKCHAKLHKKQKIK